MNKNHIFTFIIATILSCFYFTINSFAIDYSIDFNANGVSNTIDSVIVENLTQGTIITVLAGNVLNLTDSPNAVDQYRENKHLLSIYPIPLRDKSTVAFNLKKAGNILVNVFGMDGKNVITIKRYLNEGENLLQLSLPQGTYVINVFGVDNSYTSKIISQASSSIIPKIGFISNDGKDTSSGGSVKSLMQEYPVTKMYYNLGDRLLFRGFSANYSTVVTNIPTQSKTLTFTFVSCTDGEGNNYPVIQIGTYFWMVENLKTTKLNEGTIISNIPDNTDWSLLDSPGYCLYNNDFANKNTYGALYNWPAIATGKLAPIGWRVPTDTEWTYLTNYLAENGYGFEGTGDDIGKSMASKTGWRSSSVMGSLGNIQSANCRSGFIGLPAGYRDENGIFSDFMSSAIWWSSTTFVDKQAWYRQLEYNNSTPLRNYATKSNGFSVRCLMDVRINDSIIDNSVDTLFLNRAIELTTQIEEEFSKSNNLYSEYVELINNKEVQGKKDAWCWPVNTQMRVLVSASKFDSAYLTKLKSLSNALNTYYLSEYNGVFGHNVGSGGNIDRYYDDNGGVLIALMEAYNLTKDAIYLTRAVQIFEFMLSGEDSVQGGGIYQREKIHDIKVCTSTVQTVMGALMIYKVTKKTEYLEHAHRLFKWLENKLKDDGGLYNMNVSVETGIVNTTKMEHNAGYTLIANLLFYDIYKDERYLNEAIKIAAAAEQNWIIKENGAMNVQGKWGYKLIDGYIELYKRTRDIHWQQIVRDCLNFIYENGRDENGHYSPLWASPQQTILTNWTLNDQACVARSYWQLAL